MHKNHFIFLLFFFFQAEDGIRDLYVTGVQTCALPIWRHHGSCAGGTVTRGSGPGSAPGRSEERRVGKECRSRWSAYHEKKKKVQTESETVDTQPKPAWVICSLLLTYSRSAVHDA